MLRVQAKITRITGTESTLAADGSLRRSRVDCSPRCIVYDPSFKIPRSLAAKNSFEFSNNLKRLCAPFENRNPEITASGLKITHFLMWSREIYRLTMSAVSDRDFAADTEVQSWSPGDSENATKYFRPPESATLPTVRRQSVNLAMKRTRKESEIMEHLKKF